MSLHYRGSLEKSFPSYEACSIFYENASSSFDIIVFHQKCFVFFDKISLLKFSAGNITIKLRNPANYYFSVM